MEKLKTKGNSTNRPRSNKPEDWSALQSGDNGHDGVQIVQLKKTLTKHDTIQAGMLGDNNFHAGC